MWLALATGLDFSLELIFQQIYVHMVLGQKFSTVAFTDSQYWIHDNYCCASRCSIESIGIILPVIMILIKCLNYYLSLDNQQDLQNGVDKVSDFSNIFIWLNTDNIIHNIILTIIATLQLLILSMIAKIGLFFKRWHF